MPDVIIKGMEMPKACGGCCFCTMEADGDECAINCAIVTEYQKRPKDCPLSLAPEWISVERRLPEEGMDVLCYYEYFRYGSYNRMYKTIDRGYFMHGRFGGEPTNGHKARVLYWMPLPEPPEVTPHD